MSPNYKNIFKKIIEDQSLSLIEFHLIFAFKLAGADFMRMEKLMYIIDEAQKALYVETSLITLDISFI